VGGGGSSTGPVESQESRVDSWLSRKQFQFKLLSCLIRAEPRLLDFIGIPDVAIDASDPSRAICVIISLLLRDEVSLRSVNEVEQLSVTRVDKTDRD